MLQERRRVKENLQKLEARMGNTATAGYHSQPPTGGQNQQSAARMQQMSPPAVPLVSAPLSPA